MKRSLIVMMTVFSLGNFVNAEGMEEVTDAVKEGSANIKDALNLDLSKFTDFSSENVDKIVALATEAGSVVKSKADALIASSTNLSKETIADFHEEWAEFEAEIRDFKMEAPTDWADAKEDLVDAWEDLQEELTDLIKKK